MQNHKQVVVYQFGNRHNYMIPYMLFKNNRLAYLVTSTYNKGFFQRLPSWVFGSKLNKRLKSRSIPLPDAMIKSYPIWDITKLIINPFKNRHTYFIYHWLRDLVLFFIVSKTLPPSHTYAYIFNDELCGSVYLFLKNCNPIITDIYLHPFAHRIVAQNKTNRSLKLSLSEEFSIYKEQRILKVCQAATMLLCPSDYVADGIKRLDSSLEDKIAICPYGYTGRSTQSNIDLYEKDDDGFVLLWVGRDPIRKGLDTFINLLLYLNDEGFKVKAHVVGVNRIAFDSINRSPENIVWHGVINLESTLEIMKTSHLLVLPTLAEGFASVLIEAMYNKCLIITTDSSGILTPFDLKGIYKVGNTLNEFCFKTREILALSSSELQHQMISNYEFARSFYGIDAWGERLIISLGKIGL